MTAAATDAFVGREWVLDTVGDWLQRPDAPSLLITGPAGAGKSALAARLEQRGTGAGWLLHAQFCRARDDRTLDPLRFVEAVAARLSERVPGYGAALLEQDGSDVRVTGSAETGAVAAGGRVAGVLVEAVQIGDVAPRAAFDRIVRRPLEQVAAEGPLVILVDALDEALSYTRADNLVELLAAIGDTPGELPAPLRLLLTSRPDERVLDRIAHRRLDLIEDAPAGVDDVAAYARARLPAESAQLAETVAAAAAGNFLYARYVLDDPEQLEAHPLPPGLAGVYLEYLKRELARSDEQWRDRYRPLLGLLAVARGPGLDRVTLAGATELPQDRVDDALMVLGQYLSGPAPDGPFRLYHESFREFLVESQEFRVYPELASARLAEFLLHEHTDAWLPEGDERPEGSHEYALAHLPQHLVEAAAGATARRERREQAARLADLLVDFGFVQAKLLAVGVHALIADLALALAEREVEAGRRRLLGLFADLFRFDAQFLAAHPWALLDRCWLRGWWYDAPAAADFHEAAAGPWEHPGQKLCELVERWREELGRNRPGHGWLRALRPAPDPLGSAQLAVMRGHDDELGSLDVSADESRIVTAGGDGVRLWDAADGTLLGFLPAGEDDWASAAAISPDGRVIAAGLGDGSVRLLDAPGLGERGRTEPADDPVRALRFSPDGRLLAAGGWDGRLRVLDATTLAERSSVEAHAGQVTAVAFHPSGAELLSGEQSFGSDGRRRAWSCDPDGRLEPLHDWPETEWVDDIAYSDDGATAAWGLYSGTVRLWDRAGGSTHALTAFADEPAGCVDFLPDGRLVIGRGGASGDAPIVIWDLAAPAPVTELHGHVFGVSAVRVLDGGRRLVSAGDATVRLWSLDRATQGLDVRSVEPTVDHARFSPDGALLVTAAEDGEVVWARGAGDARIAGRFPGHEGGVHALAVAGDVVAAGSGAGAVHLWRVGAGSHVELEGHAAKVSALAFSPDGRRLATGSDDGTARVFDVESGEQLARFDGHRDGWVHDIAFSPQGDRVVSLAYTTPPFVWDAATGELVSQLEEEPGTVFGLRFTDDGSGVVAAEPGGKSVSWDVATGGLCPPTDAHRRAYAELTGPHGDRWRWTDAHEDGGGELTLRATDSGEPVAWFPIPYGAVLQHPSGRIWALHRGTWLFVVALEQAA